MVITPTDSALVVTAAGVSVGHAAVGRQRRHLTRRSQHATWLLCDL